MADELIDSENTLLKYKDKANVVTYDGGSHDEMNNYIHGNQVYEVPLITCVLVIKYESFLL
jgi:hypothetical protein